jgi:hypothetical protein
MSKREPQIILKPASEAFTSKPWRDRDFSQRIK